MSNKLKFESIYDNLQHNFTSSINSDTSDNSETVNDCDNDLEVVLRDRKDSDEIKTNRQKHKKHKSWNQKKLHEINTKYFDENNDTNCDENSDKENARLSQKNRRSKSVGFVLKPDRYSDDSYETAEDDDSVDEIGIDVARNSYIAQIQVIPSQEPLEDNEQTTLCRNNLRKLSEWLSSASNHYYTSSSSTTTASSPFEQKFPVTNTTSKCLSNEKTYISISNDEPESFSETEIDDELLPRKKLGWNPPELPPLPPEINLPIDSKHTKADVSTFLQKKSLAQGMMDLALLSANTNQLRYVLDSRGTHPYFITSLSLICFSLFLQILVGLSLVWVSQYNVCKKREYKIADRLNNISMIGVFLITITNAFISTFGGSTNSDGVDNVNRINVSSDDNLELI